ncbi:MAG TPA: hypothetical protein VMB34_11805 [Acetobacteraceae bacterium]|nr:hypothetical protein [Acetobacteraceae bacterium]
MTASRLQCGPADFLLRLRQRMPMNIGFTFTDEQLEALARAFGDRFDGRHAVDMRRRIYLPWSPYYVVIQAGRDRRTDFRRGALGNFWRGAVDGFLCGAMLSAIAVGVVRLASRLLL